MTCRLIRILFMLVVCVAPEALSGQSNARQGNRFGDNWFIGLSGGPTFFSGDLNTNRFLPQSGDWRFAGTFFTGRHLSNVFSLRLEVLAGKLAGRKETKQDGTPVNLIFGSTIVDGNISTLVNFSNLIGGVNPKRAFFVYGTVGVGAVYWDLTQRSMLTSEVLQTTSSLSNISAVIPAGVGAYYSIANKVNLGLEWSLRTCMTDMLDGVGEGFRLDMYSLLSFRVTLNLNKPTRRKSETIDYKKDGPIVLNLPKCNPMPAPARNDKMGMDKLPPPPSVGLVAGEEYLFKVQIFAFRQRIYSPETIRKRYHIPAPVSREYSDGLYRFTVGSTESIEEARTMLEKMRDAGVSDAFIVAYTLNGERTSWRDTGVR